ncbi:MAG: GTP cyclohydrolase II [Planctomycetaceae bacterium]|nr:GTP cyclohydrolase II [Planctomycetaceae bacterium]MCP4461928.1 GTP cyclohydrolase II [Planctomycetaceae bacterium]MDG1810135.1 GTP cyclohydrolase II [Pirellulaceae bacterium]MDG2105611.1 GTP cyclohydrolase II [Pirellulaceae bacterium]
MNNQFSPIPDAVDAIRRGEVIIVLDDEDRENEGDFIAAAELATPESINLILSGRGDFCMPILPEAATRLGVTPLVEQNTSNLSTAFLTPLDHKTARTGITAEERATCVRAIADPHSKPEDFQRPGHVHLLMAKSGGVLRRAGHTEAAVDLARMAGLAPAGILCEVLDETGNRATRDQLFETARKHNLCIITIEDLIKYRRTSEKLVTAEATANLPTRFGDFKIYAYDVKYENQKPIALVMGDPASQTQPPLVRMHSSCFTGDLLNSLRCDCGDQLNLALEMIAREKYGVLVYLPQEGRGIGLTEKIRAYALQDEGMDTVEANHALGYKADMRDYGVGIQILKDLGLGQIRLLTNNPKKTEAFNLRGFNLEVVDQVPILPPINQHNQKYLETKRDKLGHKIPTKNADEAAE